MLAEKNLLEGAKGNAHLFGRAADRLGIKFSIVMATWPWPGHSVVDEVLAGTRADTVQWLARWLRSTLESIATPCSVKA